MNCGPSCVNLTGSQIANLRNDGRDQDGGGQMAEYFFQEAYARAADVVELQEVRARITSGEASGRPLSEADLEREAAMRHPDNPFLAQ